MEVFCWEGQNFYMAKCRLFYLLFNIIIVLAVLVQMVA